MILRNLAEAIREQNWFTVVIEVLIVVVGIFVGLQIDNWNEGRKDRVEERAYLERISEDMEADLELLTGIQHGVSRKQNALSKLVAAMDGGVQESDAAEMLAAIQFSTAYGWQMPWVRRSTFEDLVSTGRLALLRDPRLRTEIQDYYTLSGERLERVETRSTGYAAHVYRLIDPDEFSTYLARFRTVESGQLEGHGDDAATIGSVTDFLKAAHEVGLDDLLNAERNYSTFLSLMLEDQVKDTEELLATLRDIIGRNDNP